MLVLTCACAEHVGSRGGKYLGPCSAEKGNLETGEVSWRAVYVYDGDTVSVTDYQGNDEEPSQIRDEWYDARRNLLRMDVDNVLYDSFDAREVWTYNELDDVLTWKRDLGPDGSIDQAYYKHWQYNDDDQPLVVEQGPGPDAEPTRRWTYHYFPNDRQVKIDNDLGADDVLEWIETSTYDESGNVVLTTFEDLDPDEDYQLSTIEYFYDENQWLIRRLVRGDPTSIYDYEYDDYGNVVRVEESFETGENGSYWQYDYSCWE